MTSRASRRTRHAAGVVFCASLVLTACGARTELLEPADAGAPDTSTHGSPDGSIDAPDAPPDAPLPDVAPVGCTGDAQCNDGVACTADSCDRATMTCVSTPDDALCPAGFACVAAVGCVASGFVVDPTMLYGIDLPSSAVASIGPTGNTMDDIALETDGTLYGVTPGSLWKVDTTTGLASLVNGNLSVGAFNALDAAPDGTLYAAGGGTLYTIDPKSGAVTYVLTYPDGYQSSGDLAIMQGTLLATVTGQDPNDFLLAIDLATRKVKVLGSTGFACIYGLAAYGTTLFGFTCAGEVLELDPTTGQGTRIATPGPTFYGASAR